MNYPKMLEGLENRINRFAAYKAEMGSKGLDNHLEEIRVYLQKKIKEIEELEESESRSSEPNILNEIRKASPKSKEIIRKDISEEEYLDKLKGAMFGRFAGCALGAPVELLPFEQLESFAKIIGIEYPPINYWLDAPVGYMPRYNAMGKDFTLSSMKNLPPDDDITYTFMAMLVLEKYGKDFTTSDVAELWKQYLPTQLTYTAERIALENLHNGIDPLMAGETNNPDTQLIGAAIRCDGWAYVNPLDPEKATEFAYRDAYLSHRRSGIYSAMYFAAVISLAFGSDDIVETLKMGLNYIPEHSEFSKQIKWALEIAPNIKDYKDAHEAVTERFPHMDWVHAINNACLTVWGVILGKDDFTKGISQTVAMAYDNDCTAATVGSILGAYKGIDFIPEYWYKPWNNKYISYLKGIGSFDLEDSIHRLNKIRKQIQDNL